MSRNGITYEQVELAAEKVLDNGDNPTIERVRNILGGTGSNTTIAKHLNEWKSKRLRASTQDLPPRIETPDPVNKAVSLVWQQIRDEAHIEIKSINEQCKAQIDAAVQACAIAEEERNQLQIELARIQEAYKNATIHANELQVAFAAEQHQHQLAAQQAKHFEALTTVIREESNQRVDELRAEKKNQLIALDEKYSQLKLMQEQQMVDLQKIYDKQQSDYSEQIQTLQNIIQKVEKDLIKSQLVEQQVAAQYRIARDENAKLQIQLADKTEQMEKVSGELHERNNALASSQMQLFSLLPWVHEREQRLEEQQQFMQELQNTITTLEKKLDQKEQALISLINKQKNAVAIIE